MGDNVIDDAQVVFEIETFDDTSSLGSYTAGDSTGKVILDSVSLSIDRPTNGYSGIGNEGETAVGYGVRSASMDHEQMLNEAAADLLIDLYQNDRSPAEVTISAGSALEATGAKFDWNNLEVSIEDDGDATVSIEGKVRGLSMNKP